MKKSSFSQYIRFYIVIFEFFNTGICTGNSLCNNKLNSDRKEYNQENENKSYTKEETVKKSEKIGRNMRYSTENNEFNGDSCSSFEVISLCSSYIEAKSNPSIIPKKNESVDILENSDIIPLDSFYTFDNIAILENSMKETDPNLVVIGTNTITNTLNHGKEPSKVMPKQYNNLFDLDSAALNMSILEDIIRGNRNKPLMEKVQTWLDNSIADEDNESQYETVDVLDNEEPPKIFYCDQINN
ncbi:hypothetical protein EDEG_01112 [Edhazardia aedis USNM 41457]|uniref:Uncharacterized protein n=1 Tax=Edhazardia aedis (strain USNM 41457) TaxID=1003232 RepID=J9DB28_EDHAE|nr:hypothetical protein EDEG_01112 [Edhazardia aedis USNM 41457]|eukprot:EJW04699.1 hypothetical protein EDEG_01112 [Edhazardia aedis USNM 41457]